LRVSKQQSAIFNLKMKCSPLSRVLLFACILRAAALLDDNYARLAPGEYERGLKAQGAPETPFKNFSDAYVAKALATPTDWVALGAVTPVKDQGAHGYCGTFGRVAAAEGQFARATGTLVSFSEQELISCIGWDMDQYSFFAPRGFMTTAEFPYNTTGPDMDRKYRTPCSPPNNEPKHPHPTPPKPYQQPRSRAIPVYLIPQRSSPARTISSSTAPPAMRPARTSSLPLCTTTGPPPSGLTQMCSASAQRTARPRTRVLSQVRALPVLTPTRGNAGLTPNAPNRGRMRHRHEAGGPQRGSCGLRR
jgi:hypothetical protein